MPRKYTEYKTLIPTKEWSRNTYSNAKPVAYLKAPSNRKIIYIESGEYRNADISGYFMLADVDNPYSTYKGKPRIEVECLWFSTRPQTTGLNITLHKPEQFIENYQGNVISDFGI